MRIMPFMKRKKGLQFAGIGLDTGGGGGGGSLPIASSDVLGGVKIGSGVNVASDGTISVSSSGVDYALNVEHETNMTFLGRKVYSIIVDDGRYQNMSNTFTNITITGKLPSNISDLVDVKLYTANNHLITGNLEAYVGDDALLHCRYISGSVSLTYNINNRVIILYTKGA